jgi:UDP-N-acetylmuramoyl-tripeptide--D-alanyl-D-alanine ligase
MAPAATVEALASLNLISRTLNLRRIAVLGDMLELGRYSSEEHEQIGKRAAQQTDVLITVGIRARGIAEAAKLAGMNEEFIQMFSTAEEAADALKGMVDQRDVLLIKGSQSIRTERIVEALLENPEDRLLLVRQDTEWKKR